LLARVEMCVSHPFGVSEVEEGEMNVAERSLTLDSVSLGRVSSAKCDIIQRHFVSTFEFCFACVQQVFIFPVFFTTATAPTLNDRPPQVTHVRRVYRWSAEGDRLTYTLAMSTSKTPELTPHLVAELVKQA
jgi:hypothetical protein